MTRILIISPFHDIQTSVSLRAAYELSDWIEKRGVEVKLLDGMKANKIAMNMSLNNDIPLVCYFGHAKEDKIKGQEIIGALIDKSNSNSFKNKIFYSMSCLSANEIGPTIVENGAKAFFGSYENMYVTVSDSTHDFMSDWVDMVTIIPKSLLLGKTCEEALLDYTEKSEKYIKLYSENINRWKNAETAIGNTRINLNNFALIGDLYTKLDLKYDKFSIKLFNLSWKIRPIALTIIGVGTLAMVISDRN